MKMDVIAVVLGVLCFSMVGCGKKPSDQELNPLNAAEKYGKVMSKTLKKAQSTDNVLYIKNKINTFHVQEGRYPHSLEELVEKGDMDAIPTPPKGMKYVYNPSTGSLTVQ
ncbi:MAG: hypothetical protein WDA18_05765 [Candidatus Ratteibacteria bacterium]